MTIQKTHRTFVALGLPRSVPALIGYGRHVMGEMQGNPAFPNPQPQLVTVGKALDDLEAAQSAAMIRVPGARATRDQKRALVVQYLGQLKNYVQMVADASPEQAAALIASAGMAVRKSTTPKKPARPGCPPRRR